MAAVHGTADVDREAHQRPWLSAMVASGMITADDFWHLAREMGDVARADIEWANGCAPPKSAREFASETIYVICNSGMKFTVARQIYDRVMRAIVSGGSAADVFRHAGKTVAIDKIWRERRWYFREWKKAPNKIAFAQTIPWIGGITCYHLAKSFGEQVAKPDVHLQRLADREGVSVQFLCERLARDTSLKVPAVDVVLWRACALGVLNSKTGQIRGRPAP